MTDDIRATLQHHGQDIHSLKKWRRAAHGRINALETGQVRLKRSIRRQETSTAHAIASLREELEPFLVLAQAAIRVRRTYHWITWAIVLAALVFPEIATMLASSDQPEEQAPFTRHYSDLHDPFSTQTDLYDPFSTNDVRGRYP